MLFIVVVFLEHKGTPKVALVTGAAKRIGAAIVRCLHGYGYNVLVHYRSDASAAGALIDELNAERPGSAIGKAAELNDDGMAENLVGACLDQFDRLDLLVNNASVFYPTPVGEISTENFQRMFATNVQAPLMLCQAAFPHLQRVNGSVVNILDIYAGSAHKDHPVYCASKAALAMLTKSLAVEFAPEVRVNGVSPGAILWPDGEASIDTQQQASVLARIPMQTTGSPEHIAEAVAYLADSRAGFISGQNIAIDGGRSAT